MPASRATSRKLRLPKPRSALSWARAASISARRVFSFCSARVANVLLHGPVKPCILAPGFLIVIPLPDIRCQFCFRTPDFQSHCVYNGRLFGYSRPNSLIQREHIQNEREPICAAIIAVGLTNLTSIRKSHSADGYTAAVTTVGSSFWICEIGMACLRLWSIRTPLKVLLWRRKSAANLLSR